MTKRKIIRLVASLAFLSNGTAQSQESRLAGGVLALAGKVLNNPAASVMGAVTKTMYDARKFTKDVSHPYESGPLTLGSDAYKLYGDLTAPTKVGFTQGLGMTYEALKLAGTGFRPDPPRPAGGVHNDCVSATQPDGSRRIGGGDSVTYIPCPTASYQRPPEGLNSRPGRPCLDENGAQASCSDGTYTANADRAPETSSVPDFSGFFRGAGQGPAWMSIGNN